MLTFLAVMGKRYVAAGRCRICRTTGSGGEERQGSAALLVEAGEVGVVDLVRVVLGAAAGGGAFGDAVEAAAFALLGAGPLGDEDDDDDEAGDLAEVPGDPAARPLVGQEVARPGER
ncbi:hypothetical protein ADL26_15290, partial [Thermoactinomyces vulgaris]